MNDNRSSLATSRRDFLATGAAVFAGTALAGSSLAAVHASSSDELKVALVGCGARGAGAATQALSTDGPVKLWAMADAFEDRLENCLDNLRRGTLKGRYDVTSTEGVAERIDVPKERQFVGLDAYRKAIDAVDVVLIAGPPGFRPPHFEYAVKAGKHVFMEKPVATDAPGVRRVMAAAKEAKAKNLKVGVGLQRHHQKSYLEAIPRVHDGELGDLITLRCYWKGGMPAKTPHPRGDRGELEHQVANWYFFTWLSGDPICEQHIHNLDVCNWIMQSQPVEAQGMGGRQVRTGKEYGNIFDHHAVEYTYPSGVKMFSQCQQIPNTDGGVAEYAHGTKGMLEMRNAAIWTLDGQKPKRVAVGKGRKANAYQVELDDLFAAIRNDTPYSEAENGALSTMTAIMGRMATYTGKTVTWDAAYGSTEVLTTNAETWAATAPLLPKEDGFYQVAVPGVTKLV
jgi:predicted dehydrogenase